jgi:hypothetical protein
MLMEVKMVEHFENCLEGLQLMSPIPGSCHVMLKCDIIRRGNGNKLLCPLAWPRINGTCFELKVASAAITVEHCVQKRSILSSSHHIE